MIVLPGNGVEYGGESAEAGQADKWSWRGESLTNQGGMFCHHWVSDSALGC